MNEATVQAPALSSSRSAAPADEKSFGRRLAEAAAFVALWGALGFALRLGGEAYLVLGIPLGVAFQLGVARRPIRAAWVREAPPLRFGRTGVVAALAFAAAFPASVTVHAIPTRASSLTRSGGSPALGARSASSTRFGTFRASDARRTWDGRFSPRCPASS